MRDRSLLVRWSGRDLRARWLQVGALAVVIALGTGTYASLLSTSPWRRQSNDASFALLHVHSLEVALAAGSTAPQGRLRHLIQALPDARLLTGLRERLVLPTQVEIHRLLVPGEIVGSGPPSGVVVDGVAIAQGAAVSAGRDSRAGTPPTVVLDLGFARKNGLAPTGTVRVAGGRVVRYVGLGQSPEYFVATAGAAGVPFVSQASYAPLFTSLAEAQRIAGAPGRVNNAVLTLRTGAPLTPFAVELRRALATASPALAATVTTRDQLASYNLLYADINSDEKLWRVIALLVLAGAALATVNLTTRVVEAERREMGIAMALGARPGLVATRPLLFAAAVSLIGVVLGVAVGELVDLPLARLFERLQPLPIWRTPFQPGIFAQSAAIGFVLPFVAAIWPVWRAVRVQPVDAIRAGHLAPRRAAPASLIRALRVPGPGYREIPLRNALRTPRRSLLTLAGVAATIATLVTIVGLIDTFRATLDRTSTELLHAAPDRVSVTLSAWVPRDGGLAARVRALSPVGQVVGGLAFSARLLDSDHAVPVTIESLARSAPWRPRLLAGRLGPGLVISEKAAGDLNLEVGSVVMLEHPRAVAGGMSITRDAVRVAGIEASPLRALAYLGEREAASLLDEPLRINALTVVPKPGVSDLALQRALLDVPGVSSSQSIRATLTAVDASLDQFRSILNLTSGVALLLVVSIAFNTATIGTDERAREHATMIAFGLPVRSVLGIGVVESLLVGSIGTLVGIGLGESLIEWLTRTTVAEVLPEVAISAALSIPSVLGALGIGIGAVALAPVLTTRRILRLDVPSTLRVVE